MEGKATPVVYCLLDPGNDIQYVRTGRTFLGDSTLTIKNPDTDSLTWDTEMFVYIEEFRSDGTKTVIPFTRETSAQKDSGFFTREALTLWSASFHPLPGFSYQLYVWFPDNNKMVTANTVINGYSELIDPAPLKGRKINFEPGQPFFVRWYPGDHSGVYSMIFRVHYQDSSAAHIWFNHADYTTRVLYETREDQLLDKPLGGPSFFQAMADQIPVRIDVSRKVISLEFMLISGNMDLAFHFQTQSTEGNLFTNLTDYSNLVNGVGIFAARNSIRVPNLELSNVTIDLLANSEWTKQLGFSDSRRQ